MTGFPYARLRRLPDVEAPELRAWDATDELLVARARNEIARAATGIRGGEVVVIGDAYGALTLPLVADGLAGIRVYQDLVTGRRALVRNAAELGIDGFVPHELGADLLRGARMILLQLPKALAELTEIADAVARHAAPDAVLVAGGRVKHMTVAQNEVLGRFFRRVQPQRAERKSRLVLAHEPVRPAGESPFPVRATHADPTPGPAASLVLCAFGGAFAGERLDIGTRALLEAADRLPSPPVESAAPFRVIDLGCGTGALAASYALRHRSAEVIATDRSAAAVRSAAATMAANGVAERVRVTLDDAGSDLPDASADLILLNPPFHLGAGVHEGAGRRLIVAAGRLVHPGGEVWTVFNSHLDHRRALAAEVGPTEQIRRTPKFTVTRSVRV